MYITFVYICENGCVQGVRICAHGIVKFRSEMVSKIRVAITDYLLLEKL